MDVGLKIGLAVFIGFTMVTLGGMYLQIVMIKAEAMKQSIMLTTFIDLKQREVDLMLRVQKQYDDIKKA